MKKGFRIKYHDLRENRSDHGYLKVIGKAQNTPIVSMVKDDFSVFNSKAEAKEFLLSMYAKKEVFYIIEEINFI